ncbi:uncharacterized protein G2W53_019728 [Senna tora]|uniref:Uncharacterized protein n=1 Tax=Senna tora TaxID=362788 RepID=A0A834TVH8_9FABA|nr:uncharacterized protein G2W53_019728 [Senna tora]
MEDSSICVLEMPSKGVCTCFQKSWPNKNFGAKAKRWVHKPSNA